MECINFTVPLYLFNGSSSIPRDSIHTHTHTHQVLSRTKHLVIAWEMFAFVPMTIMCFFTQQVFMKHLLQTGRYTSKQKAILLVWSLYCHGEDKQNILFYVDECYGEKYSKVSRRIGRPGEVSLFRVVMQWFTAHVMWLCNNNNYHYYHPSL